MATERGFERAAEGSTERAFAKLTLSLRVTGVRADGLHLLDAEMVSLDLADALSFSSGDGITVVDRVAGGATPEAVPAGDDNLVARALRAVGRSAAVVLEKFIPAGGGLGGGSSDAAAVMRWVGSRDLNVAVDLGADVPFCLDGGRARVTGVGELLDPLYFEGGVPYTLLTPPLAVSTAAVYRMWDELGGPTADGPNDLEAAALRVEPGLAKWRDRLGEATGITPVLAGSGSTWWVPGAFDGEPRCVVARTARPGKD